MTMSFSEPPKTAILFIVQSGIVAWEEREPVVDWQWKTVSTVAGRLSFLTEIFQDLITSRPPALKNVLRVQAASLPADATRSQRRRLIKNLEGEVPGFTLLSVNVSGNQAFVFSELHDIPSVSLEYFGSYRRTILIETDADLHSLTAQCELVFESGSDFGGPGVARLLNGVGNLAILRALEKGSHAALQLVGSAESSNAAVSLLMERGLRRVDDSRTLHEEIGRLSN